MEPTPSAATLRSITPLVGLAATMLLCVSNASAQNISRTITVDGNMSDWYAAPNITTNEGQYSLDCEGSVVPSCDLDARDGSLRGTGRDLKKYAYTWDRDKLYFYVERYASTTNTTTWLFYLDENVDGRMQSDEHFFAVEWWGSNRKTKAYLCGYIAANEAVGDTMRGDGFTMPGKAGPCRVIYDGVVGGSSDGLVMEAELPWPDLEALGPKNIMFQISSSQGFNLPTQVVDNMIGPGGGAGQLFPPDMELTITDHAAEIGGFQEVTFRFQLRNIYYDPFTAVQIALDLPAELELVRDRSPPGSSLIDTNGDGLSDVWAVDSLRAEQSLILELDLRGRAIPFGVNRTVAASITSWTGTDTKASNNADSVSIHIFPSPDLVVVKSANASEAQPGTTIIYTTLVTNTAHAPAHVVVVQGTVSPHLYFGLNTFGPSQPFDFSDGSPPSTLAIGTPEFSADGGATWSYTPSSGAGGAPPGFDGTVTHWRIPMTGVMATHGSNFEIRTAARVR